MKICSNPACRLAGELQPPEAFYKNKSKPDGLQSQCKACCEAYRKTPHGAAAISRYQKSDKAKACQERHWQSEETKVKRQAYYAATKERRAQWQRPYNKSEAGKAAAARYRQTEGGRAVARHNRARMAERHPQQVAARKAISHAVEYGRLPNPNAMACQKCGSPASHYHHHLGYEEAHWLDVIPLCIACHGETFSNASG